jgi:phage host-nuclease inhibitor protein Gam
LGKRKGGSSGPSQFDRARDELFSQIRHCGVLQANEPQRDTWFSDTMAYMAERYPKVTKSQLDELEALGRRYCEPVIDRGIEKGAGSTSST